MQQFGSSCSMCKQIVKKVDQFGHYLIQSCNIHVILIISFEQAYQRLFQNPVNMGRFAKIVNGGKPLTVFTKSSILDVWQGFQIFISLFYIKLFTRVPS